MGLDYIIGGLITGSFIGFTYTCTWAYKTGGRLITGSFLGLHIHGPIKVRAGL